MTVLDKLCRFLNFQNMGPVIFLKLKVNIFKNPVLQEFWISVWIVNHMTNYILLHFISFSDLPTIKSWWYYVLQLMHISTIHHWIQSVTTSHHLPTYYSLDYCHILCWHGLCSKSVIGIPFKLNNVQFIKRGK